MLSNNIMRSYEGILKNSNTDSVLKGDISSESQPNAKSKFFTFVNFTAGISTLEMVNESLRA